MIPKAASAEGGCAKEMISTQPVYTLMGS